MITVDLAGHGESAANQRLDWSITNFGADVAAAVRNSGRQRVVLVGSSMGGAVAQMAMDYGPALAELDLPIIAVNSTGAPTDEAGIRAVEPRFKVVNLQGVGHFLMLEDPQTFNRVLERSVAEWVALEPQRNTLSAVPGTR